MPRSALVGTSVHNACRVSLNGQGYAQQSCRGLGDFRGRGGIVEVWKVGKPIMVSGPLTATIYCTIDVQNRRHPMGLDEDADARR